RQHGIVVFACMVPVTLGTWPASREELVAMLRRRGFLASIAAMVAAVAIVFAVYAIMHDPGTEDGLTTPTKIADVINLQVNVANVPVQWVLTFPLGLVWTWLHGRRMLRSRWCWPAVPIGACLAYLTQTFYRHWDWMPWQVPVTVLGTAILIDIFADAI